MKGLTKRQHEITEYIEEFIASHHYSPSYREIMQHFGFSSVASVAKHIEVLKRKGILISDKGSSRSLSLAPKTKNLPTFSNEIKLPFIGYMSAGAPIEIFPQAQTITVPSFLVPNSEMTYVLRARDDSLQDELIADGDLLLIEARQEASSGETILALINQYDALIKKYYPEGHYVYLRSLIAEHPPLTFKNEEILIQGVLVGLLRLT